MFAKSLSVFPSRDGGETGELGEVADAEGVGLLLLRVFAHRLGGGPENQDSLLPVDDDLLVFDEFARHAFQPDHGGNA